MVEDIYRCLKVFIMMFAGICRSLQMSTNVCGCLQQCFHDYESSFEALLTRIGINSVHANNLHKLMIEIFKSMNGLNPHLYGSFMKGNMLLII